MYQALGVSVGAVLGALARWRLGLWLNQPGAWPWGTLAANWLGAYWVGVVIGLLQLRPDLDPMWRLVLITGFLGALTTFSCFSAEVVDLLLKARYAPALTLAALHLFGSLLLTVVGPKTVALLHA